MKRERGAVASCRRALAAVDEMAADDTRRVAEKDEPVRRSHMQAQALALAVRLASVKGDGHGIHRWEAHGECIASVRTAEGRLPAQPRDVADLGHHRLRAR